MHSVKRRAKHYFWLLSVAYARLLGRTWLAPLHSVLYTLSAHALGYNNSYRSNTGEEWFIHTFLKDKNLEVCLDIGANVGAYTKDLYEVTKATIYAVEPSEGTFRMLESNCKNISDDIIPIQAAISDYTGEASLFSDAYLSEKASLQKDLLSASAMNEIVPVLTVDALVQKHNLTRLDFIKIDTEGFEQEVCTGMQETIQTLKPKYVQFEFNHMQLYRGYSLFDLSRLLPGYTLYRLLPRGLLHVQPEKAVNNLFMFSNYVAMRDE